MKASAPRRKSKQYICIALILSFMGIIFVGIIIVSIVLIAGWLGYQEAPKNIEIQLNEIHAPPQFTLSQEQKNQLSQHGYPEAFTILFYEEETASGLEQDVRLETWDYYGQQLSYTFVNGELISSDPIEITGIGIIEPMPYTPEQFSAYMSLEEVVASAGIDAFMAVPLGKPYLAKGEIYYARSLSFGLQNGQLRYVEALAVSQEE